MKKLIFLIILIFVTACSSIEKNNMSIEEINVVKQEIIYTQNSIVELARENSKEKIEKKVISTFKNRLFLKEINKFDLSKVLIAFSDEVEIINKNKAKSFMLISFNLETTYLNVYWEYIDGEWKIRDVELQ